MPYHLNEKNTNGNGDTVKVTAAMIPKMTGNVRHTDSDLVRLVAYRAGSDETAVFDAPIDLTMNYANGAAPAVQVVCQNAGSGNTAPDAADVTPNVKNDVYYVADTKRSPQDLNTYVSGVALNPTALKMIIGSAEKLTATVTANSDAHKDIVWASEDPAVAAVDQNGRVTAAGTGSTVLTATSASDQTKFAACTVTVLGENSVVPDVVEKEPEVSNKIDTSDHEAVKQIAGSVSAADHTLTDAAQSKANTLMNSSEQTALKQKAAVQLQTSDASINLYAQTFVDVKAASIEKTNTAAPEQITSITLNITPKLRIIASTAASSAAINLEEGDGKNAVMVQEPQELTITGSAEITVNLPFSGTVYIKHDSKQGTYFYQGTAGEDGSLTFTSHHGFSPFTFSLNNGAVAEIGEIGYPTLQTAIDEVADGGTITVLKDINVSVRGRKTFVIDENGHSVTISAASGYRLSKTENADGSFTYTVSKKPSGSSSDSSEKTYAVSAEKTKNGTVKLSDDKAVKGDTVTITVKPEDGYVLDWLTVMDEDGEAVKLKDKGDGVYTFTMPASKITVEATFVPDIAPESAHPFTDVAAGTWIDTAVQYVYANGLMTGMSADTFAPNAATSRAMIWTILARRSGADTTGGANWYEKGQQWAIANGISDGSNPSGGITREQLAVILYHYAQYQGLDTSGSADLTAYTDGAQVSAYAVEAMRWAVETSLISGTSADTLTPKGSATRAQTAAMLMRFCEQFAE